MRKKILVVENDNYLRKFVINSFLKYGYECVGAPNGKSALLELKNFFYDLVVMDLDLGDMNGRDIIGLMRKQAVDLPVIVISTFSSINEKVDSFDTGCDDYVTKPFYFDELLARTKRLLFNYNNQVLTSNKMKEDIYKFGDIEVNFNNSNIKKGEEYIELTKKIFGLLSYFIQNSGQIISKEQLVGRFWSESTNYTDNTISVHIHTLRSLIEDNPSKPVYLKTKRGLGYVFIRGNDS